MVPTVISNITLLLAVKYIGGTLTSILGAMEPVTAVCIGALVFGEAFTLQEAFGIVLILVAVTLIILSKPIQHTLSSVSYPTTYSSTAIATISCRVATASSTVGTSLTSMLRLPFCSRRSQRRVYFII